MGTIFIHMPNLTAKINNPFQINACIKTKRKKKKNYIIPWEQPFGKWKPQESETKEETIGTEKKKKKTLIENSGIFQTNGIRIFELLNFMTATNGRVVKLRMFEDFKLFISILLHEHYLNLNLESSVYLKTAHFLLIKECLTEVAKVKSALVIQF